MAGGTGRRETVGVFKGSDVDLFYKALHLRLALFGRLSSLESWSPINVGESFEKGDIFPSNSCGC